MRYTDCENTGPGIFILYSFVLDSGSGSSVFPLFYSLAAGKDHRRITFKSKRPSG